jgi:hypothetical protein
MSWRQSGEGAVTMPALAARVCVFGTIAAIAIALARPAARQPEPFDLAATEHGGRVEWASNQVWPLAAASNLISSSSRYPIWYTNTNGADLHPEIVFSFFSRLTALVAGVQINPMTGENNDRPKDVEIWTSIQTSTTGFVKAGTGTLKPENALQTIAFPPVEARYVSVRILSVYPALQSGEPGGFPIAASRLTVLEGARAGYTSILARSPELASVLKGEMPGAPPAAIAAAAAPPPSAAACEVPTARPPARKSTYDRSRNVLVVAYNPWDYRTFIWKHAINDDRDMQERIPIQGVNFSWVTPAGFAPAQLVAEPKIDTVVLAQACRFAEDVPARFSQALFSWVAAGHKLIIQDADVCAGNDAPTYPFVPFPFATVNPGAAGAAGVAEILEDSTLASSHPRAPSFVDVEAWMARQNDLGDSNVVVKYDARWCGAMWAKNKLEKNGFAVAYARHGRGLVIYDGVDSDQYTIPSYRQLQTGELMQPFDPDGLPCSQPLGGFVISTKPALKSQPMAAGHTYTYPISVLGNYGYTGRVALEAALTSPDPAITVKLDRITADLTKVDEATASVTVTASPTASLTSKVVAVRGKDAAGKTNVLCLKLPERTTGGLTITSGLEGTPRKTVEIILDASGSMKLPLGKKSRWATAQEVLAEVVAKLPADYQVGLRTYGHREASTSPKACTDTELVVPVGPLDREGLLAAARQLRPRGETPLVYSALQTPGDLRDSAAAIVVLITDGEESCKGDFVAAGQTLKASGLDVKLSIVGFTLSNAKAQADLKGLAQSTGGRYYSAQSGAQLSRALLLAAVDQVSYRVLDAKGTEVARGVAGLDGKHELAPGDYTVVITAGDESLKMPVSLALRQDVALRVVITDDRLNVEK